ncbi:MAG TPA: alanine racemase [Cellvibrio sp.]
MAELCLDAFTFSYLIDKVYPVLTIDLAAIQSNWLKLQTIAAGANVAGVIKANAYGLGADQVGNALYAVGCREFFFASINEALAARTFLPSDAIAYVLGGIAVGDERLLIESNLTPVLCSLSAIKTWAKANAVLGSNASSAIKINTGMTRFGLDAHEFESLCSDNNLLRAIAPVLLMSHLACADECDHPLNLHQQNLFSDCVQLMRSLLPNLRFSLANSSGIFLGDKWHFDLLRPGAALYGINPIPNTPNPMLPVVRLSLPIVQVRTLEAEAAIGYGSSVTLPEGARVAVVAGGYADGLHRTVGLQPEGYLNGQLVRAVGRMSMDSTMFDISALGLSGDQLLGQQIEVINPALSLEYLSKKNTSLGYEILTSLGTRYQREYLTGTYHV